VEFNEEKIIQKITLLENQGGKGGDVGYFSSAKHFIGNSRGKRSKKYLAKTSD